MSIMRVKVVIGTKRTTISLDPTMFRALAQRLGSEGDAHGWIQDNAIPKISAKEVSGSSVSRQVQAKITSFLFGLPDQSIPAPAEDQSPL